MPENRNDSSNPPEKLPLPMVMTSFYDAAGRPSPASQREADAVPEPTEGAGLEFAMDLEGHGLPTILPMLDADQERTETYHYDEADDFRQSFEWTGREIDPETALQYNRARCFDPTPGSFIEE